MHTHTKGHTDTQTPIKHHARDRRRIQARQTREALQTGGPSCEHSNVGSAPCWCYPAQSATTAQNVRPTFIDAIGAHASVAGS